MWLWAVGILFILWTWLSYVTSQTANYGLSEVLRTTSLILIFFWVGRTVVLEDKRKKGLVLHEKLLLFLAYATVVACIIGYLVYVFQPVERFVGSFFDHRFHTDYWPNAWAEYLLMAWPVVVWWLYKKPRTKNQELKTRKLVSVVVLGLVFSCLLLSFSRGAGLVFIGQLVLLGLLTIRSTEKSLLLKRLISCIAILAAAIVFFFGINSVRSQYYPVQSAQEKVTFTASEGTSSITERRQFWGQAIALALEEPLTGFGPYSFRFVQPRFQTEILATSDHPHNVVLKLAMERGIPAAVLFLILVGAVVASAWRGVINKRSDQALLIVAVLGVLTHNLIDYNLQFLGIALPFWILMGLLSTSLYTQKGTSMQKKWVLPLELLIVLVILATAFIEGKYLVVSSLGRHAEAQKRPLVALHWYESARSERFSRDMHLSRAHLYLKTADPESAYEAISDYFSSNQLDWRAWKLQGQVCATKRDWVCAVDSYEKAYNTGRFNDVGITNEYVNLIWDIGRRKEVNARHSEFDRLIGDYREAIMRNAHHIALSPNVEELVTLSNTLAEIFPVSEPAYIVLGSQVVNKAREERARLKARPPGYLW
jgi:O-antigen ligase